eukprot:TRINITY_DN18613_c0_g2_i1.p1 TRINITY_DN18613_c0_g2~~TRINITY_DN18613_c0_g2_i1.p1  ORF type:complete len:127 (+),score=6.18 TRINITY_DN18613_c0_g2_i1:1-381(+)
MFTCFMLVCPTPYVIKDIARVVHGLRNVSSLGGCQGELNLFVIRVEKLVIVVVRRNLSLFCGVFQIHQRVLRGLRTFQKLLLALRTFQKLQVGWFNPHSLAQPSEQHCEPPPTLSLIHISEPTRPY